LPALPEAAPAIFICKRENAMCMFCAAIPAALAPGAKIQADQRRRARSLMTDAEPRKQFVFNPAAAAAVLVTSLAVASLVYHSQQDG
jgi:hypothetical protein